MLKDIAEVSRYRELLLNLVMRDIKIRYKNSILGFFWSLIIPLSQVATLTIVFKYIMGVDIPNYSAYLLSAIIPFSFFNASILESTTSILTHAPLVKKTYFPREILPAAIVLSNLVHFILALFMFFLYLMSLRLIFGDGPDITMKWLLLPVVVAINLVLNMGVSFLLACLNTYYEDVKYLTTVVMSLLFYALPVIFPVEAVLASPRLAHHHLLAKLAWLHFNYNPLCYLLTAYRKILLPPLPEMVNGKPNIINGVQIHDIPLNYEYLGIAAVVSLVILILGYAYFNSKKWYFAERM